MSNITENNIKRLTLEFLRAYYKYRPRVGDAKGRLDLVTDDGIVSDGQISFPLDTGEEFIASFEATSADVRSEVFYQKQKRRLWYDALAISGILTSFVLSWSYRSELYTLQDLGYFLTFVKYAGIFAVFATIYYWSAGWLRRYRYIHAVEQFKLFFANEQWISIAEDVFVGSTEAETETFQKYYIELRNQCVNYGFGLIEIKKDLTAHLVITPAREAVFTKKRKTIPFLDKVNLPSLPQNNRYAELWRSFYNSTKSITDGATSIVRFEKNFWKQWSVMACSFLFVSFIFFKEYQRQPIAYIDVEEFEKEVAKPEVLEPQDYVEVDTTHEIEKPQEIKPYLYLIDTEDDFRNRTPPTKEFYVNRDGNRISYGCARFSNLEGEYYMILDSDYADLEKAMSRIENLQKAGIDANCIWSGCFSNIIPSYLVYLDLLYTEKDGAERAVNGLAQNLKDKDLYRGGVMVLPVEMAK